MSAVARTCGQLGQLLTLGCSASDRVYKRYAIMIRQGHVPHPRHFAALAKLAGLKAPLL
jgi:hypothetical protein